MAESLGRSNARDGEARLTESRADFGRVGGRSAEPGEQPHGLFLAPVPGHLHGPVGIRRQVTGNQVQLDLADRPRALHAKQIAGAVGKVHLGQPFQGGAFGWPFDVRQGLSHFFLSKSRRLFLFLLARGDGAALPPVAV